MLNRMVYNILRKIYSVQIYGKYRDSLLENELINAILLLEIFVDISYLSAKSLCAKFMQKKQIFQNLNLRILFLP